MQISIPLTQQPKFLLEHFLANNDAKEVGSQILPGESSNRSQVIIQGFGRKGSRKIPGESQKVRKFFPHPQSKLPGGSVG